MGAAGSTGQNKESDAISSVATKVGAAIAFGEYTPNSHPENHNQVDPLLPDTFPTLDSGSPDMSCLHINHLSPQSHCPPVSPVTQTDQSTSSTQVTREPQISVLQLKPTSGHPIRRFSVERSLSADNPPRCGGPEGCVSLKSSRVYIIEREGKMTVGGHSSKESLELGVLQVSKEQAQCQELNRNQTTQPAHGSHHHSSHRRSSHQHSLQHQTGPRLDSQPLQSSRSTNSIQDWGIKKSGSQEEYTTDCVTCIRAPCQSQRSLDLDTSLRYGAKPCRKLERMYSEDRTSTEDKDDNPISWFPKENMLSFQTATTTMQANFRKHLRMVGSRRGKPQTFADRRAKTFSRSWSDPTPVKPDCLHDSKDSADLQSSSGTLDDRLEYPDWEEEREMERLACDGEDFIPPKIMLISSKVPKAEYVPDIIRRDDPSIIPILYDHEHATFDDILDEVEKKLTAYRKGCKIWNMLIFCQGGPGHLYLLKNKVATFAKVEKEEDMIQFWRRLSSLMSKLNPKPNFIHIMGCYVLGSTNGEKLIQTLKRLMRPSSVEFKSPLELSAQGKEMIEMYFDFRLFRLWKSRQQSKLLDYDDLL